MAKRFLGHYAGNVMKLKKRLVWVDMFATNVKDLLNWVLISNIVAIAFILIIFSVKDASKNFWFFF